MKTIESPTVRSVLEDCIKFSKRLKQGYGFERRKVEKIVTNGDRALVEDKPDPESLRDILERFVAVFKDAMHTHVLFKTKIYELAEEAMEALKTCEDIIAKLDDIDTHCVQMNTVANKMAGGDKYNDGDIKTVQEQRRIVFFTLKVSSQLLNTIHHFISMEIRTLHIALVQACDNEMKPSV